MFLCTLNCHLYTVGIYVPQDQIAGTPLLTACNENHLQVAKYLIEKGANMNCLTKVISLPLLFSWFVH